MFIPAAKEEVKKLNWDYLDIILITGDAYIDHNYNGISVIGHVLIDKGYKVGIISQPDINSSIDIKRLGEPKLFWGIGAGSVDSMISNYTATKKRRNEDDLTPGGLNNKRPDRATIIYTNLIRRYFKNTVPVIIGGVEASLRRIAHYDYWDNAVRRSILFDAKADILVYGMGEKAILELSEKIKNNIDWHDTRGICYISKNIKDSFIELPSYENVKSDKNKFIEMFNVFYKNNDCITAKGLYQKHSERYLIHNPPQFDLTENELDHIYNLNYERKAHPFCLEKGKIKALDTIKFSITTHRGCYGECNFCSIALHQGNKIISRSENSIIKEINQIHKQNGNKKLSINLSAPTSNMYKNDCIKKKQKGSCVNKKCIYPEICNNLKIDHSLNIKLLDKIKNLDFIKNVFITGGIRYDLILHDKKYGDTYLCNLIKDHTSGQLKIAPEHISDKILKLMSKPSKDKLIDFIEKFNSIIKKINEKKYLTYYFIAAHPGCNINDMSELKTFIKKHIKINPEQIQIFTPIPSTYSALMYYTGIDPFSNANIFVEKNIDKKYQQKSAIIK